MISMMLRRPIHRVWQPTIGLFLMFLGVALILQSYFATANRPRQLSFSEDMLDSKFEELSWVNVTIHRKKQAAKTHESMPFFVGLLSSMALKITSSIDDVVWLVPFLILPDRSMVMRNMMIYSWVCLFQTILALAISSGGIAALDALNNSDNGWSSEKILSLFAGMSLLGYGAKLFYEWYDETYGDGGGDDDDGNDEEEAQKLVNVEKVNYGDGERSGVVEDKEASAESKKRTASALFLVAFLGSLDDLTLFVPMLVGQALSWTELVLGSMIAVGLILVLCVFLGMCRPVAKCLESIPLFAIVLTFGTFLTVKALFFTD